MGALERTSEVVFWLCALFVFYAYVGYPILIWILAVAFGRRRESPQEDLPNPPFVSVLIAAHNEETVIAERIENALALEYPADHIEIVVASDGSTDRTNDLVRQVQDSRVRLIDFPMRRGKARVLNEVIPSLAGEIVILSDANTSMDGSAARRVVRWFQDDAVGVVVGRLILTDPVTGGNVDSVYWRYETFLKKCEARLGALLGANGAVYALRHSRFVPLPAATLVDDLVLPLLMKLRSGCDILYDTGVVASEETPAEMRAEFRRRSRIGAGGFQSLAVLWPLMSPTRGWIAFTFASHKLLRWCCPFLLLGILGGSLLLVEHSLYQVALLAQGLFYAAAAAGAINSGSGVAARLLRLATMFTAMNLALLAGFWRCATGVRSGAWERTTRNRADEPETAVPSVSVVAGRAPIRVVHVVIALEIGGLEVVVANLARHASPRFQLHVICLEGLGPVASRLGNPNVRVECIGDRNTSVLRSVIRLRRRLKELRPDVLHTHNEKAHIHGSLATFGWLRGPALIHTRHGRSRVTGWVATLTNRLAVWRSTYIVSVSEDASHIARSDGARPERVRVIRNGIDVGAYDASRYIERAGRTRAVAVARLTPVKDVGTMLRAVRTIADAHAHADFHLDIVGDGPSRPELEALRQELSLERHVMFHGSVDDVRPFLSAATVFVQSSLSEGISLTLLEAMAAGLPIIATNVGGTSEVVEHGVTGTLVAPKDHIAFATALSGFMTDRSMALSMSHSARARAELHFDVRPMTAAYEALYQEAAARRPLDPPTTTALCSGPVSGR